MTANERKVYEALRNKLRAEQAYQEAEKQFLENHQHNHNPDYSFVALACIAEKATYDHHKKVPQ